MTENIETQESLGKHLRKMRGEKSISIEQVAYATRISLKMLRALEDDDHTALPAPTFVRGYLQAYAKYVRLDTQDLLLRYQHHLATAPDAKKNSLRSHYLYVRERYQEKKRLVLVIVLFALTLSVAGTYFMLKAKRERNKHAAQLMELQKKEAANTNLDASGSAGLMNPTPSSATVTPAKEMEKKAAEKVAEKPTDKPAEKAASEKDATEKKAEVVAEKPAEKKAEVAAEKPAEKSATKVAEKTETKPATPPTPAPSAVPAATPAATPATAAPAAAATDAKKDEKKAYNALLKVDQDVWLRFQTDDDEIRDLTLRGGKALMLRANKVIKIFSGNLGAIKATLNGKPIANLSSAERPKSVILPESEAPNYPLPLFPQFQKKSENDNADQKQKNSESSSGGASR